MVGRRRRVAIDPFAAVGCTAAVAIGSGGSSVVYRARQQAFDRLIALKVLNVPLTDERARRRFERELSLAGRLTGHPNVVTVFASGFLPDGRGYVQMEYCPGGSLADRVVSQGPLAVPEVVAIGVKLAGVLELARIQGIVHRDVKPANVLITRFGEPALADFGIAVVAGEVTGTTHALTPVHAAPEVLESRAVGPAADQWSLGSTLHTLLAGRAPYAGIGSEGLLAGMLRVLNDPVPVIGRPDLPPSVTTVLARTMAKAAEDRYPTPGDVGRALQEIERAQGWAPTRLPVEEVPEARAGWADGGVPRQETTTAPGEGGIWPERVPPPGAVDAGVAGSGPVDAGHTQHWSRHRPAAPAVTPPAGTNPDPAPAEVGAEPATGPPAGDAPPLRVAGEATRHFSRRPAVPAHPVFTTAPPPVRSRTRQYWGIGAAVAVVLLVAGVVVVLTRPSSHPRLRPGPVLQNPTAAADARYAPRQVVVSDEQPTIVTLRWTDPSHGAIPYVVQVSDGRTQVATSATQAVVAGLDPAKGYCFVVVAVYGVGSRALGNPVCIRGGQPAPPAGAPAG